MTDNATRALEILAADGHLKSALGIADASDPTFLAHIGIANVSGQHAITYALLAIADAIRDSNQSNKCPSESPNGNPCIRANWHTGNHQGPGGSIW